LEERRRAAGPDGAGRSAGGIASGVNGVNIVLAFALEVAMLAAFVYWGFKHTGPWNLVLGLGVPAVTVVLWGVFLAPRSERRRGPAAVRWLSLLLFLAAAAALFAAGSHLLGVLMAVAALAQFTASILLARVPGTGSAD